MRAVWAGFLCVSVVVAGWLLWQRGRADGAAGDREVAVMREVEIEFQVEQARKALAGLYALCRLHQDVTGERAASLDEVRDYFEAQTPAPVDDPWGAAYWLEREGDILFLWSAGPDGMKGTSDDVSYTEDG